MSTDNSVYYWEVNRLCLGALEWVEGYLSFDVVQALSLVGPVLSTKVRSCSSFCILFLSSWSLSTFSSYQGWRQGHCSTLWQFGLLVKA
jgi:hypothetical protein